MATKKKIVEKGSYEKGKVETYPSKKAMVKHEKKETKAFEKGESKKPSPMKAKTKFPTKAVSGAIIKPANPTSAAVVKPKGQPTAQSPVTQKKSPTKMKKC